jgi:hypothetical protein
VGYLVKLTYYFRRSFDGSRRDTDSSQSAEKAELVGINACAYSADDFISQHSLDSAP